MLALLMLAPIVACRTPEERAYDAFSPSVGMTKAEVVALLGQPDGFRSHSTGAFEVINGRHVRPPYEGHLIELLDYRAITKAPDKVIVGFQLSLRFVNGTLQSWTRGSDK